MKLKIGAYDYKVLAFPDPRPPEAADDYTGMCAFDEQIIYIDSLITAQSQAATLLHEVIHAAFHAFSLETDDLCEEDVCGMLDNPLATIIRDNPRLHAILRAALTRDVPIVKGKA